MCPVLHKRDVTRVSADVALTYGRDGNYVDVTSGYAQVTCFSCLISRTLHSDIYIVRSCFDAIIAALWDHPIQIQLNCYYV